MKNKINTLQKDTKLKLVKMGNKKIDLAPHEQLNEIQKEKNFTITKIANDTKVHRDIIKRFLDGKKINHIDYIKIANVYPLQDKLKNILNVSKIDMFGCLTDKGIVRHLFLNEQKEFYFLDHLKLVWTRELIGIHNMFTSTKIIVQAREDVDIFKQICERQEYLVKTETSAYYGFIQKHERDFHLHCLWTGDCIEIPKDEKVMEVFDLVVKVSANWSDIKDNRFSSRIGKISPKNPDNVNKKF